MALYKKDLSLPVALFFTIIWILFIHSRAYSGNDFSRLASVESLVHRGTWKIDDSPFNSTIDRIKVGDHFYSDKPPGLPFLAAGLYSFLHRLGMSLQATGCTPDISPTSCRAIFEWATADHAHFILTLLLISSSATVILVLLYRLGRHYQLPLHWNILLLIGAGLGTALFPYSTVFTNHVPSALGIFVPLYLLLTNKQLSSRQSMLAGFAVSMAVTFDLSAGVYAIAYLGYLAWFDFDQAKWFLAGCLPPALFLIVLDYQIVGNPFPPQLYAPGYEYEGSSLYGNISGFQQSSNIPRYTFNLLLGERGVFMFYPILVWYLLATIRAGRQSHLRNLAIMSIIATGLYTLYFVLSTDNYGGFAFSPRWLLNPVPILAAFAFVQPRLYQNSILLVLVGGATLFSVVSTYDGALNPWSLPKPILYMAYAPRVLPERVEIPVSMSGYRSFEEADPLLRQGIGGNPVFVRIFDAGSAFVVPKDDGWWFIHESTPIALEFRNIFDLSIPNSTLAKFTLRPQAERWVERSTQKIYSSHELVPTDHSEEGTLPITFIREDGDMDLVGFTWDTFEETLILTTAWHIISKGEETVGERRFFVHILDGTGTAVSQKDQLSARFNTLYPDDLFFQLHRLSLETLPAGRYWIQIGVYDPDSGERLLTNTNEDRVLLMPYEKAP